MERESEAIPWAGVVILRNRRVLTLQETDKPYLLIPGGKREPGETDEEAATREVLEELGVGVAIGEPLVEIIERSKTTKQLIRFLLFNGQLAAEPDAANLPGKTQSTAYVDSTCERNGFELGNLSRQLLPILVERDLID